MENLMNLSSLEEIKKFFEAINVKWSPLVFGDAIFKAPDGEVGPWWDARHNSSYPPEDRTMFLAEGWEFYDFPKSHSPSGDQPRHRAIDWADMPEWLVPYAISDVLWHINASTGADSECIFAASFLRRMHKEGYRFRNFYDNRRDKKMKKMLVSSWEVEGGEKSHVFVQYLWVKRKRIVFADSFAEACSVFAEASDAFQYQYFRVLFES